MKNIKIEKIMFSFKKSDFLSSWLSNHNKWFRNFYVNSLYCYLK